MLFKINEVDSFALSSSLMGQTVLNNPKVILLPVSFRKHSSIKHLVTPSCPALCPPIPLSMDFSRQEYCSGLPFPSSGAFIQNHSDLPHHRLSTVFKFKKTQFNLQAKTCNYAVMTRLSLLVFYNQHLFL